MNEVVESRVKHREPCSRTRYMTPLSSEDLDFFKTRKHRETFERLTEKGMRETNIE